MKALSLDNRQIIFKQCIINGKRESNSKKEIIYFGVRREVRGGQRGFRFGESQLSKGEPRK